MELLSQKSNMNTYNTYDSSANSQSTLIFRIMNKPWLKTTILVVLILVVVAGVFLAGYSSGSKSNSKSSSSDDENPTALPYVSKLEWNGTCPGETTTCPESYQGIPPLILISLDGFRPEYLSRGLTPNLQSILECGSSAKMHSVFPTKTFPNHYTIVTGLYPESHGIIDNYMYDPEKRKIFELKSSEANKPYWWGGEPIWTTAQKQGKRSHCFFWPGSDVEINGVRPTVYRKYDGKVKFTKRVKTVLEWVDLPNATRPHFITLYFNQPDKTGHRFGPNSYQVNGELSEVDNLIAQLFDGLQKKNLLNCVNVIIVSDHGMTKVNCNRRMHLNDYVNTSSLYTVVGTFGRLKPKGPRNDTAMDDLVLDLQCKHEHWRVYKKEQLPVRYHYSISKRIEPIFVDIDLGWTLVTPERDGPCNGGKHGYDNYYEDMQAIFIAYGPAFKSNYTAKPFLNIELYELMSDLMNITASPNNGTAGSLHHLLKNPSKMVEQVEPQYPEIGTVPVDNMEYKLRIFAANCSCDQVNETGIQKHAKNIPLLHKLHLPFGIPQTHDVNQSHLLLYNHDYISSYDVKYRLPTWSSFTLSEEPQTNDYNHCWRGDARIPFKDTSTCSDYNTTMVLSENIFQRPLFPPMFSHEDFIEESYFVTNTVPKSPNHVAIIEQNFNRLLSSWIQTKGSINVIAGPAFNINGTGIYHGIADIMQTHMKYGPLVMPTHYFYIISWCENASMPIQMCNSPDINLVAFLLPNVPISYNCESPDSLIKKNSVRVIDIEILSGTTFFTTLPIYDAIRLRTTITILP